MDHFNQHRSEKHVALVGQPSVPAPSATAYMSNSRYFDGVENDGGNEGLIEYLRILSRYKKTIFFSSVAGLIFGLLVGVPMKPKYRATTMLEVLNLNDDFLNMKQASPTTSVSTEYETSEEQTQAKLLLSNELLNRVFARMDPPGALVRKIPIATSGWRSWFNLPQFVEFTERQQLIAKAADSLDVRPIPKTRVLEIKVDSPDPKIAADFANALVKEFIQYNLEARLNASHGTSAWLAKEIDDARARLQVSEDALQKYARETKLIFVDSDDTNVQTEKLRQVQQELSTATSDRIAKQARFETAKNSPPDALADVLQDPSLQDARSKVDDLTRKIADLSAVFNPEYGKVKQAQAQLATIKAAYDGQRNDLVTSIANDFKQAKAREGLLATAYDGQIKEVTQQGEKEIQYNILKREVDSNRQLYDTMLQQTKAAAIASAMHASTLRIADPAQVPELPISPRFKVNAALGFIAGLFGSVLYASIRERADRTLQQPGDIKQWTDLQELGTIPHTSLSIRRAYGAESPAVQKRIQVPHRSPRIQDRLNSAELVTLQHKPSVAAEAFRSALTSIFFVGENDGRPRVLVFTSANPGDGKTTVVSNLAIATAEIRQKVLVIDADLRRPRMDKLFNLSNERGLGDLLSGDFSEEIVKGLIQETSIPGVHVITGGTPNQAAAHLLYSPNFALLLGKVKEEYDLVLIDTPPSLQMTDARVAGRLADAVIFVARAGLTTRDSLLTISQRFAEDGTRILGTILNGWDPKRSRNGSYYQYGRSYQANYSYRS